MRYLPLNDADRATMLERIGVENIDACLRCACQARLDGPLICRYTKAKCRSNATCRQWPVKI